MTDIRLDLKLAHRYSNSCLMVEPVLERSHKQRFRVPITPDMYFLTALMGT